MPPLPDDIGRFERRIDRRGPIHPVLGTRCWTWTGSLFSAGYGQFHVKGPVLAHRYSWRIYRGPLSVGLLVCHHCDVRRCVRPGHLFTGSYLDNAADRDRKGRQFRPVGELNNSALLTEELVRLLRGRYRPRHGRDGAAALAREFGLNHGTVCDAVTGKTWGHLQ
jgi:hypothetical protein